MNQLEILLSSRALKAGFKSAFGLVSACLFLSPVSSNAATYSWKGGAGTNSTATSWVGDVKPPNGSDVVYGNTAGKVTMDTANPFVVNDFRVDTGGYEFSAASHFTIELNSFSGSGLNNATFGTGANNTFTYYTTLQVSGSTAFSGTIKYTGVNVGGKAGLIKSGAGTLNLEDAKLLQNGETRISGGTLVLSATNQPLDRIRIGMGSGAGGSGIIEIAGTGVADSSITRTFSNSDGATISFGDSSNGSADLAGFGAVNGNLVLAFGGIGSLQQINWVATGGSGAPFKTLVFQLGTAASTHTVFLKNSINLQVDDRTIRVGNGTAAIDADIEGTITMTSGTPANRVLTKDGTGTLRLSGNSSTAAGRLLVSAGTVLVDGTWASTTSNATYGISVASGATLGGDGTITVSSAKLVVDGVLQAGRGGADQSLTLNTNLEMKIDSVLAFTIGGESDSDILARTGGSWLFQADQLVKITSLGFTGDEYILMTGLDAAFGTTYDLSLWRLALGSNVAGTFRFDNGTLLFDAVPEPSSLLLLGLASGGILAAWRRKRSRF